MTERNKVGNQQTKEPFMLHRLNLATVLGCVVGLFFGCGVASARDRSFAAVLEGLKKNYHLKPQTVTGVWLAKCVAKVIPTPGVSKIDFVLFGEKGFRELATARDLNSQIQGLLGSGWKPFVQMNSSADREQALVFARPSGRRADLLILDVEPDDTVAVFVRVNPKGMKEILHQTTHDASL
jgi:hypothetical protein